MYIFLVHFHLNHSKSCSYSQLYIIIGIYHITLLLLLCFTCGLEIMQTWYNADWYNFLFINSAWSYSAWSLTDSSQLIDWLNCSSLFSNYQSRSSQLENCWVHISDTQPTDCILELLIKTEPGHCFGVTLANNNK